MAFDSVPWFVEGGAQHSAEVARLLSHISTGGNEGVLNSTDLRVMPLATPGTQIRVLPGVAVIRNRALGSENQTYLARNVSETAIDIPASGSSGPRTHLIVARVENPNISGEPWNQPANVANGPYVFARVIPDVPISTRNVAELNRGYSAIPLARVTVPANTATITGSMITDLRGIANPVTGPQPPPGGTGGGDGAPDDPGPVIVCPGGSGNDGDNPTGDPLTYTDTDYINWPFNAVWNLAIPSWANYVDILIDIQNAQLRQGSLGGQLRLLLAGTPAPGQTWRCDWPGGTVRNSIPITYTDYPIAANLRGTTIQWRLQTQCSSGFLIGALLATPATKVVVTMKFKQKAG